MNEEQKSIKLREIIKQVNSSLNSSLNHRNLTLKELLYPFDEKWIKGGRFIKTIKIESALSKRLTHARLNYYLRGPRTMESTGPAFIFPIKLVDNPFVLKTDTVNVFPVKLDYSPYAFKTTLISAFPAQLQSSSFGSFDVFAGTTLNTFVVNLDKS